MATAFVEMNSPQQTDRVSRAQATIPDDRDTNHQT